MILCVVLAYCPQAKGGIDSVPGQHQAYLNQDNDEQTPREAFWEDLMTDIKAWNAMGNQVVLTGNWNCDIRLKQITDRMAALDLQEVLLEKHGGCDAPETWERGSNPINGVFASWALHIKRGGFHAHGMGCPSDHCAGWFDMTYVEVLGHAMPVIVCAKAQWLQNRAPRVVKEFNAYYQQYISFHQLDHEH